MAEVNKIRFKRGNEAQRTGITPADGEPIWVSDQKKLYVGDGTTAGGIAVDSGGGGGATSLSGLTDVDSSLAPNNLDVLRYNSTNTQFEASAISTAENSPVIYYQASMPTSGFKVGDIYIPTP